MRFCSSLRDYNQEVKIAKVGLGVCGGIAAYKAAEIVRLLQNKGLSVQVIMTRAAQEFVRPLTFAALSGEKVITDLFSGASEQPNIDSAVEHIAVAQSLDVMLVAPASADTIAKFANGLADDFLSTTFLATTAPVVLAPAMNVNMWEHPATRDNIERLTARGVRMVEPGSGYLACGMTGPGRLAANEAIVAAVLDALGMGSDLEGETVLITAGPTREPIDPVRYISNRSSGKMGYALASAALRRGANVILISGPCALTPPAAAQFISVRTAEEMRAAVMDHLNAATVVIKTAAVADYRPRNPAGQKIKRAGSAAGGSTPQAANIELEATPDILAEIVRHRRSAQNERPDGERPRRSQIIFGFAAETENVLENARLKLGSKGVDAIVVNDVTHAETGFDADRNAVTIILRNEVVDVPAAPKIEVAHRVLDAVMKVRLQRLASADAREFSSPVAANQPPQP